MPMEHLVDLTDDFPCLYESAVWSISDPTPEHNILLPEALREGFTSGDVDGKYIVGRAVGPFFLVNGSSRNKRFYSKELWEKALDRVQEELRKGSMVGTIGHECDITDDAFRRGDISHIVKNLWIDESQGLGMGEVLILGTPAGLNLNTYLRAGFQFPVSSRAFGKFTGQKHEGCDIVDPQTYMLKTFDFVHVPGVLQAIPRLVEAAPHQVTLVPPFTTKKEPPIMAEMTNSMYETLAVDKRYAEERLTESLSQNETLKTTVTSQKIALDKLQEELDLYKKIGTLDAIQKVFAQSKALVEGKKIDEAEQEALVAKLAHYESFGTPEELELFGEKMQQLLTTYEELGTPQDIASAFEESYALLKQYQDLGTPGQLRAAMDMMKETLAELHQIGTPQEMIQLLQFAEEYKALGTPEEIQETLAVAHRFMDRVEEDYSKRTVSTLCQTYKVQEAIVTKLLSNMSVSEARDVLESLVPKHEHTPRTNEALSDRYTPNARPEIMERVKRNKVNRITQLKESLCDDLGGDDEETLIESHFPQHSNMTSRLSRIMENMGMRKQPQRNPEIGELTALRS